MGSIEMGSIVPTDSKLLPKQPHPSGCVSSGETADSAVLNEGGREEGEGRDVEETDSEDDGSTEGDREEGKVLSSERPQETADGLGGVGLGGDKTLPPLTEYIINVVHFLDAILSNNSTDDHMKEFISQGGMDPLLRLLALPVLPLDFPTSAACTAITGACRSIMVRECMVRVMSIGPCSEVVLTSEVTSLLVHCIKVLDFEDRCWNYQNKGAVDSGQLRKLY